MARIITGERVGRQGGLRIGCCAVVWDDAGRMLLTRRGDNGLWCLPGGGLEPGESAAEGAAREVLEETELVVRISRMIGLYSSPHVLVEYADGNRVQTVSACFEATIVGGAPVTTSEALEVGFFTESDVMGLDVMPNHVERIADAFAFQGTTFVR